jgi:hypothetical protein
VAKSYFFAKYFFSSDYKNFFFELTFFFLSRRREEYKLSKAIFMIENEQNCSLRKREREQNEITRFSFSQKWNWERKSNCGQKMLLFLASGAKW